MSSGVAFTVTAVTLGVIAFVWPSMLGWVTFIGFGGAGLVSVLGVVGITHRRTSVAFGMYMMSCAMKFGTSFSSLVVPQWCSLLLSVLFFVSVAWFIFEARKDGAGGLRAT